MVLNKNKNTVLAIFMDEKRINGRRGVYDIKVSSIIISEVKYGDQNYWNCRVFSYM